MLDPPWVIAHTVKSHLQELECKESEISERLAKAREKEVQRKREAKLIKFGGRNKRQRLTGPESGLVGDTARNGNPTGPKRPEEDDDQFLPLDTGSSLNSGPDQQDDNLSSEVKALLRQYATSSVLRLEQKLRFLWPQVPVETHRRGRLGGGEIKSAKLMLIKPLKGLI